MKVDNLVRGCLYGGLLGDAYGSPFELTFSVDLERVNSFIQPILDGSETNPLRYTDDTEMALCICDSLKRKGGFDATDLAHTFAIAYNKSPTCRLYGTSIGALFHAMEKENFADPQSVATRSFKGTGSYGNGGAMRIAPAAIYGSNLSTEEFNTLIMQITAITHTHALGLYGALLQAHAVRRVFLSSLNAKSPPEISAETFIEQLRGDLQSASLAPFVAGTDVVKKRIDEALAAMLNRLELVLKYVTDVEEPKIFTIQSALGNGEAALESVPTALYVFLRCLKGVANINHQSLPLRCSVYASTIGFDTDTIGCMAAALAGAHVGAEPIGKDAVATDFPHFTKNMLVNIEGLEVVNEYVAWLTEHLNNL